jgi:hypothetical protein
MSRLVVDGIPPSKRAEYMRPTNEALYHQSDPCSFATSGSVIINHTADAIVCEGANFRTGDPTIHGDISAIIACTAKIRRPSHDSLRDLRRLGRPISLRQRRELSHVRIRSPPGRLQVVCLRDDDRAQLQRWLGRADLVVLRCLTPESGAAGRANGHAGPDLDQRDGPAVQLAI